MDSELKNQLHKLLLEFGYADIARALSEGKTEMLTKQDKETLIMYANRVRNGDSIVRVNPGMAGHSPTSGGSGFLSGIREGFGES